MAVDLRLYILDTIPNNIRCFSFSQKSLRPNSTFHEILSSIPGPEDLQMSHFSSPWRWDACNHKTLKNCWHLTWTLTAFPLTFKAALTPCPVRRENTPGIGSFFWAQPHSVHPANSWGLTTPFYGHWENQDHIPLLFLPASIGKFSP